MKRILSVLAIAGISVLGLKAQQAPVFSQYFMNNFTINPAVAGIESYADIKAAYRNQWTGIGGDPYNTYYLTAHMPIGLQKANPKGGVPVFGKNGDERSQMNSPGSKYLPRRIHHGVGLTAISDRTGIFKRQGGYIAYALHFPLWGSTRMSIGASGGVSQYRGEDFRLEQRNDPALPEGTITRNIFDYNAGIWIYSKDFFLGASAVQIMPTRLNFSNSGYVASTYTPNFHGTIGYRIKAGSALDIVPSVMVRYSDVVPYSIDANVRFVAYKRLWGGVSYRRDDAIVLVAGTAITSFLNFTYSYDYSLNSIGKVSNGGHEFVLGTVINNRRKILSPEQLW